MKIQLYKEPVSINIREARGVLPERQEDRGQVDGMDQLLRAATPPHYEGVSPQTEAFLR